MMPGCNSNQEDDAWALMLLRKEGRTAVWVLCAALGVDSRGVPGQACRLLERYLHVQMRIYNNLALATTVVTDNQECQRFKNQLTTKFPLLMVSCIQLAAKMSSADFQMNASFIRACLIFRGVRLSVADINDSEFRVYSTLGFRVPLWTSVDAAEVLAVDAGMPQDMLQAVALVVNVAEYCRDRLDSRVRWAANLSPACSKFNRATLRTLHLVAGCVAATARYLSFKGPDPAPRLAELTRAPLCYIRCVSDCVLSNLLMSEAMTSTSRKRTRE
ncbi:hypothetical protein ABMA27_000467 [Loxostege sticticalis]|uniref:Uncharacterized protein n=1 Tax=Loxostege sticticalis TaxID=481309 RepID=A0ABR3INI7_LOXSC